MWNARTKEDLIIEVWEKLDCENVGRREIEAIEIVVKDRFGRSAVDPPMVIARQLADEGAELRHSEIMELHVERASDRPYEPALRNLLVLDDLRSAARSIRGLENLRRKYHAENDREGLRQIMESARRSKQKAAEANRPGDSELAVNTEIVHWITVWLQNPEVFETWLNLRTGSAEFIGKFGKLE